MGAYPGQQNLGCPVNQWQVTNAISGTVSRPSNLNEQVLENGVRKVKPTDNTQHLKYTFYTRIEATDGGSNAFFGPYYVDVGCTATSTTFADNGAFLANQAITVSTVSSGTATY